MDSVQLSSPRARFLCRSLKREQAAETFDRLTWTDQGLADQVAFELTNQAGDRRAFQALSAILASQRPQVSRHFAPHKEALLSTTSRHGAREGQAEFYRSLLERFPETVSPELLVLEVLPNEGGARVVLEQLEQHPEWGERVADCILSRNHNQSLEDWRVLSQTAAPRHRPWLAARLLQPGKPGPEFWQGLEALGRIPNGLDGLRQNLFDRLLLEPELRRLYAGDVMAVGVTSQAYAALLDQEFSQSLAERLQSNYQGDIQKLSPADQRALVALGSVSRHRELIRPIAMQELERRHDNAALDSLVDTFRSEHQNAQMRRMGDAPDVTGKIQAAREYLRSVVHRVIPSSLEFQTRPVLERLGPQLTPEEKAQQASELLEEFVQAARTSKADLSDLPRSAQEALWLAHMLGSTGVTQALQPYLAHALSGPVQALTSEARRQEIAQLKEQLAGTPVEQARPLVERLLACQVPDAHELWSQRLPDDNWAAHYSADPARRYAAYYGGDQFREFSARLGGEAEHEAILRACTEVERLIEQGVPADQARQRATFDYLVPGRSDPAQRVELTPRGVQVGSVRLKRKG
ncbi:MAG: hypothetical protein AMXMBFR33_07200 [Candidatus Xenobia bacterium]